MKRRRVSSRILRSARSAVLVVCAACGPTTWCDCEDDPRAALENWFFCDACDRGERAAVTALHNVAVPPIDRVLSKIPDEWHQNLQVRYSEAAKRAGLSGTDSVTYVNHYLVNFRSTVWSRSAIALADINTSEARAVLREALDSSASRGYRSDVIRDIRNALVAVTTTSLAGDFQPRAAEFLDTVLVTRAGNVPWDGDESVSLHGAPFPDDVLVGFRSGNTQLGFVAAARPGEYAFTILNVGPSQDSQFARIRVTTFPASPTTSIHDLTGGPFPVTILQSFSRATSPPDYVHYFRFKPVAPLTVTATAEWIGSSQIALVWDDCTNRLATTNPGRISAVVLDAAGNAVFTPTVTLTPLGGGAPVMLAVMGGVFAVPRGWIGTVRVSAPGLAAREVVAWEGAALHFILPFGSGGATVSEATTQPSPNSSSHTIPGGGCRLLSVLQSDTSRVPPIVRLRVTSP